ncbi:MAG: hypothetical protein LC802_12430, partial [Acidobacteria bacterium]|nr:hypothetical protein [Acidobacteriota bacterium]
MDLNDFKNLAEAFQAIAIGLAVIIGGIWAFYRFWSLQEMGRARWELEKLQKSLTERATINVSLFARSETNPGGSGYYIEVAASLTNIGNRTEVLNWSDGGVFTAPVLGRDKGNVVLGELIKTNQ